jgi:hypothetical protein
MDLALILHINLTCWATGSQKEGIMTRAFVIIILLFPAMAIAAQDGERSYERVESFQGSYLLVWASSPESTVEVSAADAARGFVEVSQPLRLVVRSNRHEEYSLAFRNMSSDFDLVTVTIGEESERFGREGILDFETYDNGLGGRHITARVWLRIAPGTEAGVYPWPVAVSLRPPLGTSPHWRGASLRVWTDPRGGEPRISGQFLSASLSGM